MRVCGRALILGVLVAVCTPWAASAAPIAITDGGSCGELAATESCGLFALDPFTPHQVDGILGSAADLFLFEFTFLEETTLTVTTSSYGLGNFDPTLGLFQRTGEILTVPNPLDPGFDMFARFFDKDPFGDPADLDDHFEVTLGSGTYLMALYGAELFESLRSPLFCDAGCLPFDRGSEFAFSVSAFGDGAPAPVPEPGTLVLLGTGLLAAVARGRAKKRAQLTVR